jgi:hypothetical protein
MRSSWIPVIIYCIHCSSLNLINIWYASYSLPLNGAQMQRLFGIYIRDNCSEMRRACMITVQVSNVLSFEKTESILHIRRCREQHEVIAANDYWSKDPDAVYGQKNWPAVVRTSDQKRRNERERTKLAMQELCEVQADDRGCSPWERFNDSKEWSRNAWHRHAEQDDTKTDDSERLEKRSGVVLRGNESRTTQSRSSQARDSTVTSCVCAAQSIPIGHPCSTNERRC